MTLAIVGSLTGLAWTAVEELVDEPEELEKPEALQKVLALLDARFALEKSTELPDAFEEYFYRGNRKPRETLFDYVQRTRQSTKKVKEFKIELPDKVQGWLLLRRAGLTAEQKALIMAQVGSDLAFDKVVAALQNTLGQTQVMTEKRGGKQYLQQDELEDAAADDSWYDDEQDDVYYDDDGYGEDDYYYDDDNDDDEYGDDAEEGAICLTGGGDYDVDEFDDVYSNYLDARKQMAALRSSRGFYPIVALAPDRAGPGSGKGKGAGRPQRRKGKRDSPRGNAPPHPPLG